MSKKRTIAQTPSPKKDRIYGSDVNPKGSASSESEAKKIVLSAKILATLSRKLSEFKKQNPTKSNITLSDLKAVYRRGSGAYSKSHRPTISGGKPNTRSAWSMARVNKFLLKASGKKVKKAYVQDDDLIRYEDGGLLAPNGKPTNLNPEQYKLVRTPEFKAWFGDWENDPENASKVVDENGEPLVVYRGMAEQSSKKYIFNYNYYQLKEFGRRNKFGFYFTNSYEVANGYAIEDSSNKIIQKVKKVFDVYDSLEDFEKDAKEKAIVKSYFIDIRNCLDLREYDSLSYVDLLKILGASDKEISNFIEKYFPSYTNKFAYIKGQVYDLFITQKEKGFDIEDSIGIYFRNKIVEKYDGVVFKETTFKTSDVYVAFRPEQIKLSDGTNTTFDSNNPDIRYAKGGEVDEHKETYAKWKSLVNMSYSELKEFYDSKEGKEAGLSSSEAKAQGIDSGRESARWIMKMKSTPKDKWTPTMWKWAKKQISFISRMSGNEGKLYDEKGNKTRKHTSLLIWGHNPKKHKNMEYAKGGRIDYSEYYKDGGKMNSCEKFDSNGERKIDQQSIDDLTYCVNKLPQTKDFHFHDGQYDADRKKLHKDIIYDIKKNLVCVENNNPIAILMGGSPASGKSTFLKKYRPYLLENEILKIDADEIRSKLPEYEGYNATQTHLETKDIVNLLLSDRNIGIPCLFDLIYDGTMNNTKSYMPLIHLLKSLGYNVFVVYIDKVPKDVIVKRALERYKKSGRFVPLEVIDDFFSKGKSALNEIKKEVDGYMIVDGSDSNYHVIEKGGMQLPKNRRYSKLGEPIKITTEEVVREYKRGGELNPDNPKIKNEIVHKSGEVGGMLVGKRHSEGGIKAVNKATNQLLEMEGGEVVITRNAVSDNKKREFEGKMMTNREILSKINESGGGVSFAKGGSVKSKEDCGCNHYDEGGKVKNLKDKYPQDFRKGYREEKREHIDTFRHLKQGKISLKEALESVVAKHLTDKPNYYKNYKHGGFLTLGNSQIPSFDAFMKLGESVKSPFLNDDDIFELNHEAESHDHKFYSINKKLNPISNLLAYETYLYDKFGILFSQLPSQVKNALTLGKQALIDNYIKS